MFESAIRKFGGGLPNLTDQLDIISDRQYGPSNADYETARIIVPLTKANRMRPNIGSEHLSKRMLARIVTMFKHNRGISRVQAKYEKDHEDLTSPLNTEVYRSRAIVFLRNTVPELHAYNHVEFDIHDNYWLVDMASSRYRTLVELPLTVGQCLVYPQEKFGRMMPSLPKECAGPEMSFTIDPRDIVGNYSARWIIEMFPCSMGMRVCVWGHVTVHYESEDRLNHDFQMSRLPRNIGGLAYDMKVTRVETIRGHSHWFQEPTQVAEELNRHTTTVYASEALVPDVPALYHVLHGPLRRGNTDLAGWWENQVSNYRAISKAVLVGVDYWWYNGDVRRALVWRTLSRGGLENEAEVGEDRLVGAVLSLGSPRSRKGKNDTFVPLVMHQYGSRSEGKGGLFDIEAREHKYKAGFILPVEFERPKDIEEGDDDKKWLTGEEWKEELKV